MVHRDCVEELLKAGLAVSIGSFDGFTNMTADDVLQFLDDQETWWTQYWGVSLERLRAFNRRYEDQFQCCGTTRAGRRCKLGPSVDGYSLNPKNYDPDLHDYCSIHSEVSNTLLDERGNVTPFRRKDT